MKKLLVLLFTAVFLVACGSEAEEKDVSEVKAEDESGSEQSEEKENDTETQEVDKVLADDDNVKATLTKIERVEDKDFDEERYDIHIEVENKTDKTIEVQTREVSADGKMIDDMIAYSETVSGGKSSDSVLVIQNYDGDLPDLEESIDFTLVVLDEDTFEDISTHDVKVEF